MNFVKEKKYFFFTVTKACEIHKISLGWHRIERTMFFKHIRGYIVFYCVFGMWSSWEKNQYKWLLRAYSILSITPVLCSFWSAFILNEFFNHISLTTSVTTSAFFTILFAHSVIAVESLLKSQAQMQIIQSFSIVDQMFSTKLNISMSYRKEKRQLFIWNCVLISMILFIKIIVWLYTYFYNRTLNFFYSAMYSSWIFQLRVIQVLFLLYLIKNRLILINKELTNIKDAIHEPDSDASVNIDCGLDYAPTHQML